MLVYGDAGETIDVGARLAEIASGAKQVERLAEPQRCWAATEVFLDAAQLAQGLTDLGFMAVGEDDIGAMRDAAAALVLAAAALLAGHTGAAPVETAASALRQGQLPRTVMAKLAEGYAYYALYPEAYLEAAKALTEIPAAVVGIRSIGLGLAALIAAATGRGEVLSVRPAGHPFRRELRLAPRYRAKLLGGNGPRAVADEGPGLSGSSFGAVIDAFDEGGVPEDRIHLFPSHAGAPGRQALPELAVRWPRLQRHVVSFDELFVGDRPTKLPLAMWFADMVGEPTEPLRDVSGGGWRRESRWPDGLPPAHLQQERRKFLLRTGNGSFLLKFIGLGRAGQAAARRAEILAAAGFTPPVLAFRHGFLLERWLGGTPLPAASPSRDAVLDRLSRYLAFRAIHLPAQPASGASSGALAEMLIVNGTEALGAAATPALRKLAALRREHNGRRVMTDNRLHMWEWLATTDGQLLKTDAIDHCAAHDLIGCQNIAWDIAGAVVEFGLSADERETLLRGVDGLANETVDRTLLAFIEPCYIAFQLGYYAMAADANTGVPEEAGRLSERAAFYRDALAARL